MSYCSLVDLTIDIFWKNDGISHKDHYFADQLNCWRDIFPGTPIEHLIKHSKESSLTFEIGPGELVPAYDPDKVHFLPWPRLNKMSPVNRPVKGRFYPQGILTGILSIFKDNIMPFRCIGFDSKGMRADLNHPMAKFPLAVNITVQNQYHKSDERGGNCIDWIELAMSGPGMQTRYNQYQTDFFASTSFARKDISPDKVFYETDRFVHHIDEQARQNLSEIYREVLSPGERVLDLMAGWESHLPDDIGLESIHGLGLNENELKENRSLSTYNLQDLNVNQRFDFENHMFDAVICSLSIEYLIQPVPIFTEVARILKPGGTFIVTFSNRWFPEKSISIWEGLHDFERMGLVTEYFLQSGGYDSVSTISMRGYPRPYEDKYFPKLNLSDPVYAVIGKTII
jgi:SAM-dependent methyltransferase